MANDNDLIVLTEQTPAVTLIAAADARVQLQGLDPPVILRSPGDVALQLISTSESFTLLETGAGGGGSSGGSGGCPPCGEICKVLFTNAGDVLLLNDGRIAVGRY